MTNVVHVVAGVIEGPDQKILLAKRPVHLHQGGLWEFPGGKVETGETPYVALARELREEIGIDITSAKPLMKIPWSYPDKTVLLDVWRVDSFQGIPVGVEGQQLVWAKKNELCNYPFPAANKPVVTALVLPSLMMITGELSCPDKTSKNIDHAITTKNIRFIQLRDHLLADDQYVKACQEIMEKYKKTGILFAINRAGLLCDEIKPKCRHLSAAELREFSTRPDYLDWLGASCHNASEIAVAEKKGVDYITLSPVLPTDSHPGQTALGWQEFGRLAATTVLPVYALGGISDNQLELAKQHHAFGIAGIRCFMP